MPGCPTPFETSAEPSATPVVPMQAPHIPFPSRQLPAVALPVPNSLAGTSPEIKSALTDTPWSTYCLVAACSAEAGFAGRLMGPVIVPPAVGKKFPPPAFDTD